MADHLHRNAHPDAATGSRPNHQSTASRLPELRARLDHSGDMWASRNPSRPIPAARPDRPIMDSLALARTLHVVAVVIWIGGLSIVTTALLPAIRRGELGADWLQAFQAIERRF